MKLTEQEIEKLAEDKYGPIYGQNKLAQKDAFIEGFQTCQDMQKNNYVIRTDNSQVVMNLQKTIAELNLKIEESEWISVEIPKDGTTIIRWHNVWKIPMVVKYNINECRFALEWITGDLSNSYPEQSFEPNLWQPLPKPPIETI